MYAMWQRGRTITYSSTRWQQMAIQIKKKRDIKLSKMFSVWAFLEFLWYTSAVFN